MRTNLTSERDRVVVALGDPGSQSALEELSSEPGLYALWPKSPEAVDELGLRDIIGEDPLAHRALYLGSAKDSLYERLTETHLADGKTGWSTVRRTLAALLDFDCRPRRLNAAAPTQKQVQRTISHFELSDEDESRLTEWMLKSLIIRTVTSNWTPIKDLEQAAGAVVQPPLDRDRPPMWEANPWRPYVAACRERMRARASRMGVA